MKFQYPLVALTCALFAGAPLVAAGTLATYDFSTDLATSFKDAALVQSATSIVFTAGTAGGTGTQGGRSSTAGGHVYTRLESMGSTQSTASRFAFTLAPVGTFDFGQLSFDYGYQNTGTGAHPGYTLHYKLGVKVGTAAEIVLPSVYDYAVAAITGTSSGTIIDRTATFDLSAYQNVGTSVAFTLYVYATDITGTVTTNETGRIDNISLTTAAIPEPSTAALLMGGVAGMLVFAPRRRRQ